MAGLNAEMRKSVRTGLRWALGHDLRRWFVRSFFRFHRNALAGQWELHHLFAVLALFAVLLSLAPLCRAESRLTITNVSASPQFFAPQEQKTTEIMYKLSQSANVTIKIYDMSDYLIKTLVNSKSSPKGDNRAAWDGTDKTEHPVPPGIYRFAIEAKKQAGASVLSDLTDKTGGEEGQVETSEIDAKKGTIAYFLRSPCLVITRLGIGEGGPLLRTLEYRKAKPAGLNHVPWDGLDNSGTISFLKQASFVFEETL